MGEEDTEGVNGVVTVDHMKKLQTTSLIEHKKDTDQSKKVPLKEKVA